MNDESVGPGPHRNGTHAAEPAARCDIREVADGVYLTQHAAQASAPLLALALSPSLWNNREEPAFELKFHLASAQADVIARWAAAHLQLDPHADPKLGDAYRVHGLYFDTPALDVFHRTPGYKKRKYRLRRYGDRSAVFLEQKRKLDGKVAKRRIEVAEAEVERLREAPTGLDWTGHWFHRRIARRLLQPSCLISYERQAFFGHTADGPLRLTLDRNLRSKGTQSWLVEPVLDGPVMLPEQVLLELKYRKHVPALFRRLMQDFSLVPAPLSKYRLAMRSLGHAVENGSLLA